MKARQVLETQYGAKWRPGVSATFQEFELEDGVVMVIDETPSQTVVYGRVGPYLSATFDADRVHEAVAAARLLAKPLELQDTTIPETVTLGPDAAELWRKVPQARLREPLLEQAVTDVWRAFEEYSSAEAPSAGGPLAVACDDALLELARAARAVPEADFQTFVARRTLAGDEPDQVASRTRELEEAELGEVMKLRAGDVLQAITFVAAERYGDDRMLSMLRELGEPLADAVAKAIRGPRIVLKVSSELDVASFERFQATVRKALAEKPVGEPVVYCKGPKCPGYTAHLPGSHGPHCWEMGG